MTMRPVLINFFFILFIMLLPAINSLLASEKGPIPFSLLKLDLFFSHHVLIVEKSTHTIHVYKNNSSAYPELIAKHKIATGKKAGNKFFQGDFRTPEGIYDFTEFLPHQRLIQMHGKKGEIYGVGAFVMDYPNPIDLLNHKTGSGIWLHSTNDETRIEKGLDSRGCIVSKNNQLIDLSKYIELNKTNIIVTHELNYLMPETHQVKLDEVMNFLENWRQSWQEENINKYIAFYADEFTTNTHHSLAEYKKYKRSVFWSPGTPSIELKNVSILAQKDYLKVIFIQNYQSKTITDNGKKVLFLKKDKYYNWKILSEKWSKVGTENFDINTADNPQLAFRPSMRFFNPALEGQTEAATKEKLNKKGNN